MTRLVIVIFFGTPRSDAAAARGGEAPLVMTAPLVLLAIPAAIGGLGFFARHFLDIA